MCMIHIPIFITMADAMAAMKIVITQPVKIFRDSFQFTEPFPPTRPTPTAEPILHCVVDSGRPMRDPTITTTEAPSSMKKPRQGVTVTRLTPTVAITR